MVCGAYVLTMRQNIWKQCEDTSAQTVMIRMGYFASARDAFRVRYRAVHTLGPGVHVPTTYPVAEQCRGKVLTSEPRWLRVENVNGD